MLMENQTFKTEDIYVPAKRWKTLNPKTVDEISEKYVGGRSADSDLGSS